MNSRLHNKIGGEDEVLGPYCSGNPSYNPQQRPDANRELLLELCFATGLCVANTFLQHEPEHQVTYHELWANPVSNITYKDFVQLDLVLTAPEDLWKVRQVRSDRWQALASYHFLVEVVVSISTDRQETKHKTPRPDLRALEEPQVRLQLSKRFEQLACQEACDMTDTEVLAQSICKCLHEAAATVLPVVELSPNRPWIRPPTLTLIKRRNDARNSGNREEEVRMNKHIRGAARKDRASWLNDLLVQGSWADIAKWKKLSRTNVTGRKLHDANGCVVESVMRAETFAEHLEKVQWAVRPLTAVESTSPLGQPLQSRISEITEGELRIAVKQLRSKRAAIQVPAEYLKAVLGGDLSTSAWLLSLMRLCWDTKSTPKSWHIS